MNKILYIVVVLGILIAWHFLSRAEQNLTPRTSWEEVADFNLKK